MRAAIIENGRVVNIIEVETLDGHIDATGAHIGMTWDGSTFGPNPDLFNNKKVTAFVRIREIRKEKMEEGISQGPRTFELTLESKEWIDWARDFLTDNPGEKVSYPGIGEIGASGFQTLVQSARAKVLALRKRESELYELILAATTVEELQAIDLTSGW